MRRLKKQEYKNHKKDGQFEEIVKNDELFAIFQAIFDSFLFVQECVFLGEMPEI